MKDRPTESFGFRTGRDTVMAVNTLFNNLNLRMPTFIINLDISKCFDMISHQAIIREAEGRIHPKLVSRLAQTLKYKVVDGKSGEVIENNGIGTPQGSVVSPALCNMILNCIKSGGK